MTDVSIIIPVYNCNRFTRECLESVTENTADFNYEILLVDNGSAERQPTSGDYERIRTIRNESNPGFPVAINQGMAAAGGDHICWLNNDVVATPGWLIRMMRGIDRSYCDMVGPRSNFVAGKQYAIPGVYKNKEGLYRTAVEWAAERGDIFTPVNWLIGFCLLMDRKVYDLLGPLDESFGIGNSEDIDYCLRAQDAGLRMAMACGVFVHHYGHNTFTAVGGAGYCREMVTKNRELLAEKWGRERDLRQ